MGRKGKVGGVVGKGVGVMGKEWKGSNGERSGTKEGKGREGSGGKGSGINFLLRSSNLLLLLLV